MPIGGSKGINNDDFPLKYTTNYIIETTFIGETNNINYQLNLKDGSVILCQNNSAISHIATLQEILQKHKFDANFIKIDTDGFDFKVLRSGMDFKKRIIYRYILSGIWHFWKHRAKLFVYF